MAKSHKTCMERLLCHVLLEFSYTFEHIWTNILTQCTQLPVPIFCCLCISGFPAIKSAPIFWKNYIKNQRLEASGITKERRGATTGTPEGSLAQPHPRPHQGASWLPYAPS